MKADRKLKLGEKGFWQKWFAKLLFTLISVKLWGLIAGTIVSTWLLMIHLGNEPVIVGEQVIEYGINGAQWVTFNTTIWALIFGMKEIFRISEQRDYTEQISIKEELENKVRLASINRQLQLEENEKYIQRKYEIVGANPEESTEL